MIVAKIYKTIFNKQFLVTTKNIFGIDLICQFSIENMTIVKI